MTSPRTPETPIMCACGARGRNPHAWEPGEWCPPTPVRPDVPVPPVNPHRTIRPGDPQAARTVVATPQDTTPTTEGDHA